MSRSCTCWRNPWAGVC